MKKSTIIASRILAGIFITIGFNLQSAQVAAQDFSNTIFIGDSNSDNGRFFYLPDPISFGTHATGIYTTSPDLMWSAILGQKFGIVVKPSDAPGGGNNYAAGGATVAIANGGRGDADFANEWSGAQQVQAYLANVGNSANPNALYTVFIGNNDLHSWFNLAAALPDLVDNTVAGGAPNPLSLNQRNADIVALAGQTAGLVGQLHDSGARYFLVPGDYTIGSQAAANAVNYTGKTGVAWDPATATAIKLYNTSMWNQIAAKGINFIPADFFTVANYVILNPLQFGVTNTDWTKPVCGGVLSIDCTPANWVAGRTGANSLFADNNAHLAGVGQQIEADYSYGLIVAPGEVSTIANQAFLEQVSMNDTYMSHINNSFRAQSPQTIGYWVLGGADHRSLDNGTTASHTLSNNEAVGVDYQYTSNMLFGGFFDYGTSRVGLTGDGHFDQSGATFGGYASYKANGWWLSGLADYNWLSTDVNRVTPVGIAQFTNATNGVGGANISADLEAGYNFQNDNYEHGLIIGYSYIHTDMDGFTENGNFNSLQFGRQGFSNNILSGGYGIKAHYGEWEPSLKATYNSIIGSINRDVTTTLTTVAAPSYTMPAIAYGKNWINLTAGLGYKINDTMGLQADFTNFINEKSITYYGGTLSLVGHF